MRIIVALVAAGATAIPSLAVAQAWSVQWGGAARAEYTDNYFFNATDRESAFIASIAPFVTAVRRTENSEVTALLTVGANRVWGSSSDTDYASGRGTLAGWQREARSTWSGDVSLMRAPSLQSEISQNGVVFARAYVDSAAVNGAYTYALTEAWSLGATARGYSNHYDSVQSGANFENNRGYLVGATADYALSSRTRFSFSGVYSHFASDLTRDNPVTATLGVVHSFSPQLIMSASAGGYWTNTETLQTSADRHHDTGWLFGGSILYDFSESTRLSAGVSQTLAPSGTGALTKNETAFAALSHAFSDRLTGRLGAGYTRTIFPASLGGGSFDNDSYSTEVGASYRFAERWTLDAGYRYARAQYAQGLGEPRANFVFLSVGYNWPGASINDWIGARQDAPGSSGTGPLSLPERFPDTSGPATTAPASSERSPFDQYFIP